MFKITVLLKILLSKEFINNSFRNEIWIIFERAQL